MWLAPGARRALDLEFRFLPRPRPGARLLDVGVGDGSFLVRAREAGWQASGVDIDPVVVANAGYRALDVLQGGLERHAGSAGCFDAITMNHVIEHLHRPTETLALAFRLLKDGGRLWIETPNIDSFGHAAYGAHWRGLEAPRHLVVFSARALEHALRSAGFSDWRHIHRPEIAAPIFSASERLARRAVGSDETPELGWRGRLLLLRGRLAPRRAEYLSLLVRKP